MAQENKKEGFSYTSPELQRKNASRILIIEGIVLVIVFVGIVGLLMYLGKINVGSWLTNKRSLGNSQPVGRGRMDPPNNTFNTEKNTNIDPTVTLVSDTPLLTIKEATPEKVLGFVKTYDVFGKKYLLRPGEFSDFVENIELHLTDVVQPSNKYFLGSTTTPVSSSKITFQGQKLILTIHLSKEAYSNPNVTPEQFFMQNLVFNLYHMQKDPSGIGLSADQQKELSQLTTKLSQDNTKYVVISRKSN